MQTHEIISELVITNNTLSTLLDIVINKKDVSVEDFHKLCKDKLEISYPFSKSENIDEDLRTKIQEYLKHAHETRYNL